MKTLKREQIKLAREYILKRIGKFACRQLLNNDSIARATVDAFDMTEDEASLYLGYLHYIITGNEYKDDYDMTNLDILALTLATADQMYWAFWYSQEKGNHIKASDG